MLGASELQKHKSLSVIFSVGSLKNMAELHDESLDMAELHDESLDMAELHDESLDMDDESDSDEWLKYYEDPNTFLSRHDFPEFHGDSSEDTDVVRDWLEAVDKVFDEKDVKEDRVKVTSAVSGFQSSALEWWNDLQLVREQKGLPEIDTWNDLIRAMYRQYVPLPGYMSCKKKRLIDDAGRRRSRRIIKKKKKNHH